MPDSFNSIEKLYIAADPDDKDKYIFAALKHITEVTEKSIGFMREDMQAGFKETADKIEMIRKSCLYRRELCEEAINGKIDIAVKPLKEKVCKVQGDFVTKNQAKYYCYLILFLGFGFGLGTGLIKWIDLIKKVIP